jgi:hypothetical protein
MPRPGAIDVTFEGRRYPSNSTRVGPGAMPRSSKEKQLASARDAIAGLKKTFAPGEAMVVGGIECTRDEIIADLQAHVDALRAVDAARAAYRGAVGRERDAARAAAAWLARVKLFLLANHGGNEAVLSAFGWKAPKKPGPKTVASKLQGVRRAEETRAKGGKRRRRR